MTQIFLSYSRTNLFLAKTIVSHLQPTYNVWMDERGVQGGTEWEIEIRKRLRRSHVVLLLVTNASIESEWVQKEIELALELRIDILPIVLERFSSSLPEALLKLAIAHIQAIDVTTLDVDVAYEQVKRRLDVVGTEWARFQPLVQDLKNEEWRVRASAAEQLGKLGDSRAIPYLTSHMLDDDERVEVRETAAVALGEVRDERAVIDLVRALDEKYVSTSAIEALGKIGGKIAVERLIRSLTDEDPHHDNLRVWAVMALGETRHPDAVTPLFEVVMSANTFESDKAFEQLTNFVDKRVLTAALKVINNPQSTARHSAVGVIARFQAVEAVDTLVQLVCDSERDVRGRAIVELGELGSAGAAGVDAIIATFSDGYTIEVAVEALGKIGDTKAIEPLEQLLELRDEFRIPQSTVDKIFEVLDVLDPLEHE